MRVVASAALLVVAACAAAEEGRESYAVTLDNGAVFHGFIEYEDDNVIRFEIDAPWDPGGARTVNRNRIASLEPEWSGTRERRIRRGWEERGRIEAETVQGPRWLPREDVEFARRAAELEQERAAELRDAPVHAEALITEEDAGEEEAEMGAPEPPAAERHWAWLWAPHAAVVAGAVVLIGMVARLFLMA